MKIVVGALLVVGALAGSANAGNTNCCQAPDETCSNTPSPPEGCAPGETLVVGGFCGQDGICDAPSETGCCPCDDTCVEDFATCAFECFAEYFVPNGSCDDGCPSPIEPDDLCGDVDADFCASAGGPGAITCQPGVPCVGTQGNDVFCGSDGDDLIIGAGGDDVVCAGPGDDRIKTGQGADRIDTTSICGVLLPGGIDEEDQVSAKGGNDVVVAGPGSDTLSMGTGDDVALGGGGADELTGSSGNDCLDAEAAADSFASGGTGDDTCCADRERRCEQSCVM